MAATDDTILKHDEERHPLEVIAEEFSSALRAGLNPSIDTFAARAPQSKDQAMAILRSIAMMEGAGSSENARRRAESKWHRFVDHPLTKLGDFRIIREIGRGGMGIIYEAEQISLKRSVALKVLNPSVADSKKQLERFRRESEAIARLHHTNIVPVFGIGEEDGIHYFAMQLIEGRPLNNSPALKPIEVAKIGIQAASAIAYAHEHGVLHRDIKPSNLLLDNNHQLWVTDFGLAKLTDVGELTQDGDIMGTLKYMAPEQLEGRSDSRTDIYALGLTLYELAVGRPAFDVPTSLAGRIRNHSIATPRTFNPQVPRDLETIILKATARDAASRYATASELQEDLRSFIDDRPIRARRASIFEKTNRWMRRNPLVAGSLTITLLSLATATVLSGWGYWTTQRALFDARVAGKRAILAKEEAEQAKLQAESNLNVAVQAFDAIFDNVAQRGVPKSISLAVTTISDSDVSKGKETESQKDVAMDPTHLESALTPADAELLTSLLSFYREFANSNGGDESLLARTAAAYQKSGQIQQRLGRTEEAIQSFDEALNILIQLVASTKEPQLFIAMAQVMNDRGLSLMASEASFTPDVVGHHFIAAQLLKSQSAEVRKMPAVRYEIARARDLAGSVLSRKGVTNAELSVPEGTRMDFPPRPGERPGPGGPMGQPERFEGNRFEHDRRSPDGPKMGRPPHWHVSKYPIPERIYGLLPSGPEMEFMDSILRMMPPPDHEFPDDRRGLGPPRPDEFGRGRNSRRGPDGFPRDIAQRIDEELNESAELLSGLCTEFTENDEYQFAFAQVQRHRMQHFLFTRRANEAAVAFDLARISLDRLVDHHPNQPRYLLELADTLSYAGSRMKSISETDAEKYMKRALKISQQLCDEFPSAIEYQAILASSHEKLGVFERGRGNWKDAQQNQRIACDMFETLHKRQPGNHFYQLSYLIGLNNLAQVLLDAKSPIANKQNMVECRDRLKSALQGLTMDQPELRRFVNLGKQNIDRLEDLLAN
jgi:eukaryotic-like serine/threonine-protein kinase